MGQGRAGDRSEAGLSFAVTPNDTPAPIGQRTAAHLGLGGPPPAQNRPTMLIDSMVMLPSPVWSFPTSK